MALHQDPGAGLGPVRELGRGSQYRGVLDWFYGVEEWQVKTVLEHVAADLDAKADYLGVKVKYENPV